MKPRSLPYSSICMSCLVQNFGANVAFKVFFPHSPYSWRAMPCGQQRLTQGWSYTLRLTEIKRKEDGCEKVHLSAGSTRDSPKSSINAVHLIHAELVMSHLVLLQYRCCQFHMILILGPIQKSTIEYCTDHISYRFCLFINE